LSTYRTAIDDTARTIQRRAGRFRNQVVMVVALSAIGGVAAVITRSITSLLAVLLLVPACGAFFYADSRLLNAWRRDVLRPWTAGQLDVAAFCLAIRANSALPKPTTEAMLATLPSAGDLVAEQKVLTPTRQAVAAVCGATHDSAADALLLNTIASGNVVAVVLMAIWSRRWNPLLGLVLLVALPVARGWIARRRQARCAAEVQACRSQIGFSESDFATICATLG
jgi:hypothetical protein